MDGPGTAAPPALRDPRGAQGANGAGSPTWGGVLSSREVWAALRAGTLDAGGALLHEGRPHRLGWWFDGQFFIAQLLPANQYP
ncbi:hypothetical protein [Sorangium sp. So ce204]|uniref:hypothetical protein n=1 Tax=Sorangium sp. So ce204 TaxID=3133288 RepID=UPI003F63E713